MKNEYNKDFSINYTNVDRNLKMSLVNGSYIVQDIMTEFFKYLESDNVTVKNENNAVWVLVRQKIHFNRYPIWGENIKVSAYISEKSKIRLIINSIARDEKGEIIF